MLFQNCTNAAVANFSGLRKAVVEKCVLRACAAQGNAVLVKFAGCGFFGDPIPFEGRVFGVVCDMDVGASFKQQVEHVLLACACGVQIGGQTVAVLGVGVGVVVKEKRCGFFKSELCGITEQAMSVAHGGVEIEAFLCDEFE